MGRQSYAIKEVEQLKDMVKHSLSLCDVCLGCELRSKLSTEETNAWQKHRQGIQLSVYRCNSFRPNPKKRRIMPKFNGDS